MRAPLPQRTFERPFDVIVIGAGINGAGIARDATLRGLSVLLVDKGDVGAGTTSRSTRLVHGGLRYLEHFEVPLVRESLRERERLMHIAPHLVHPMSFLLPIYEGHKRGPRLIRMGMMAYDALSLDKSMERHRMLSGTEALAREPGLRREGLRGAAAYYDAQAEYPERLALENALDARRRGAVVLPYMRVSALERSGARVSGVALYDELHDTEHRARGALVVNAAGPWVDAVLGELEPPNGPLIGGTKGSHLVVEPFPGAPREAVYSEAVEDGRPYFVVPWSGRYLIGTTDTRYDGDLDDVVATDDEIAYLIGETNRLFPGAELTPADVLYTYAGVRPLPAAPEGVEASITRSHVVHDHETVPAHPGVEGLLSIVGGKITTYRRLAEETVDLVVKKLERRAPKCRTHEIPLPGGTTYPFAGFRERFRATSGLPVEAADRLLRIYGTRAAEVLDFADGAPELREPFDADSGALGAEVVFALRTELAETLTDVIQRRTLVGYDADVGLAAIDAAAELAVRHLGWSDARAAREADVFRVAVAAQFRPRAAVR